MWKIRVFSSGKAYIIRVPGYSLQDVYYHIHEKVILDSDILSVEREFKGE